MIRFTEAEEARLLAACPPTEKFAVFVRRMALAGVESQTTEMRRLAAFIIGVLSPEHSPEDALDMLDQYLAAEKGE